MKFAFKASGSIGYGVEYNASSKKFTITLTGSLNAKAELAAGVSGVAEIAVGAKGTIISIKSSNIYTKTSSSFSAQNTISISGGEISCYVSGKLANHQVFEVSKKFLKGWSKTLK